MGEFEGMGVKERVEFETRLEGQQKTVEKLWRACCLSFAMISGVATGAGVRKRVEDREQSPDERRLNRKCR